MVTKTYDVAIIGGGIVGLSAAIYCGRLNLRTIVFSKEMGGTLPKTDKIENYPGFKSISGMDLFKNVLEHAKEYEDYVEIISNPVTDIKKSGDEFSLITKKQEFKSKNVIFATGSEWRKLNVPGEKEFSNKGVHYCALCDGPFYKDKTIAVVGGSDSAAKEALLLSKYAKKVYMLIRSWLKAEPVNAERVKKEKKIQIIDGIQVKEIKGSEKVDSIELTKEVNGKKELKLDGVFVEIGHIPNSELAKEIGVKLNKKAEIIIDKQSKTNISGVYAAGDVADTEFKQAITGVGEAVKAAYDIYNESKQQDKK